MYHKYISVVFIILFFSETIGQHNAVTIVPIADLIHSPLSTLHNKQKTRLTYRSIPMSGKQDNKACPRLHQLIFNEIVTILEEKEDEVKVQVSSHFCQSDQDSTKHNTYWSSKKNFITFDELKKNGIETAALLPPAINYKEPKKSSASIVTLIGPFQDLKNNLYFSAGTRLVKTQSQPYHHSIIVQFYNPHLKKADRLVIPKHLILVHEYSPEKKLKQFVHIIRSWAHQKNGFIPYVWGGCSFTKLCHQPLFEEKKDDDQQPYYYRKECRHGPYGGIDCSNLILRVTQMCDIPYFYKNSTTLAKYLDPLKKDDSIQEGDIIWFPGHVIIVSDVKNNLVVESRGYEHGYGKLQETSLSEQFKGIKTYSDLKKAYLEQQPLERLDKYGTTAKTLTTYKILKLASVWHPTTENRHSL